MTALLLPSHHSTSPAHAHPRTARLPSDPFAKQPVVIRTVPPPAEPPVHGRQHDPSARSAAVGLGLNGTVTPSSVSTFTPPKSTAQGAHTMSSPNRLPPAEEAETYDEFGAYRSSPSGGPSQSTSGRPRPSYVPTLPSALPIPASEPLASTSTFQPQAVPNYPPGGVPQRKRQSHNPTTTLAALPTAPPAEHLTDEYVLHPSVYAYKQAHPRRPMVGFGPYVLLQTLGEGEFGKVKLGVHTEYGVEVAIKLIRRGSLEDEARASKVEREIDVLKMLKHPNIVRMFDVIDTEKYIGIVLEYAGGGELFDYILANRYLKEKDAQRLFAQLISGVDYLHKKQIIHRDLKLENLLLDKHRNIIITDFGFANRFDAAADDLMATSCGSPCYAAPELVVSEGLYVGSAVDIWSCGVILYAMLSGYLPYDDDPANPDGDNINLLYKYIMSTRLNFPDHMTSAAKNLLQMMLVPNPEYRCRVYQIVDHLWLNSYRDMFARSIEEQEFVFQESMYRKSQTAKRELAERRQVQQEAKVQRAMVMRSQSSAPGQSVSQALVDQTRRAREGRHHSVMPASGTVPDFLASSSGTRTPPLQTVLARQPIQPPAPVLALAQTSPVIAQVQPTATSVSLPMPSSAPIHPVSRSTTPQQAAESLQASLGRKVENQSPGVESAMAVENERMEVDPSSSFAAEGELIDPLADARRPPMSANTNRHTIQVEYDENASYEQFQLGAAGSSEPLAEQPESLDRVRAATQSDIEMDSEGSHDEFSRGGTVESAGAIHTPATVEVMTPFLTTPGIPEVGEESKGFPPAPPVPEPGPETEGEREQPVTPRKVSPPRIPATSPSTPRASASASEAALPIDATPRSKDATPRGDRGAGRRSDSMPSTVHVSLSPSGQRLAGISESPSAGRNAGRDALTPLGLPNLSSDRQTKAKERRTKGMSLDKFGLAKLLGQSGAGSSTNAPKVPPSAGQQAINVQAQAQARAQAEQASAKRASVQRPSTAEDKKNKRRTLQLIASRTNSSPRSAPVDLPAESGIQPPRTAPVRSGSILRKQQAASSSAPPNTAPLVPSSSVTSPSAVTIDAITQTPSTDAPPRPGHKQQPSASSSAAKKVMDWFRRKSTYRDSALVGLKQGGARVDSNDSFVRVATPGAAEAGTATGEASGPAGLVSIVGAMSSASSVEQTQEGNPEDDEVTPSASVVAANKPTGLDRTASASAMSLPAGAAPASTAEPARQPLGPAQSKTNITPPSSATSVSLQSKSKARPQTITTLSPPSKRENKPAPATAALAGEKKLPMKPAAAASVTTARPNVPRSGAGAEDSKLRVHTGVVDQSALSSKPPKEVMDEVTRVLQDMGIDLKRENEYRLRCTRARRRKAGAGSISQPSAAGGVPSSPSAGSLSSSPSASGSTGLGLGNMMSLGSVGQGLIGSASSSKVDARGLPVPSPSIPTSPSLSSGLLSASQNLRGLLRRGSSYQRDLTAEGVLGMPGSPGSAGAEKKEPVYGEHGVDSGDEVKFVVELCRMKNLPGLYQLNIKRLRGGVWSFKFIYQTVLERCDTLTH